MSILHINYKVDIERLKEVRSDVDILHVSYKKLTTDELRRCLGYLPNLKKIEIVYTSLDELPEEIYDYEELWYLRLIGTNVTKISDGIGRLKKLEIFALSQTQITHLSDALFDLPIRSFELEDAGLTQFPEGICRLNRLTYLQLSKNKIGKVPDDCFKLSAESLINIFIEDNELEAFPLVDDFKSLTFLSLGRNPIKEWNDSGARFPKLAYLMLAKCSIERLCFNHDLPSIQHVDLSYNDMNDFPSGVKHIVGVNYFDIYGNHFTSIPNEVSCLQNSYQFNYDLDRVKDVPESVRKLNYNYEEDFSFHRGGEIPLSIFKDKDRRYLDLTGIDNPIFPDDIPDWCPIVGLTMKGCNLNQLPKNIDKLKKLYVLNLDNNHFTELPKELYECKTLETLKICNNKLETFKGYDSIKALTSIEINGNPCVYNIEDLMSRRAITVRGFEWDIIQMHHKIFLPFAAALKKAPLSDAQKLEYLNIVKLQKKVELPMHTFTEQIRMLCIPYRDLQMEARKLLLKEDVSGSLSEGAVLYIAGKTEQKRSEIRAQCKALGFDIVTTFSDRVTHIILGRMPKDLLTVESSSAVFIAESDLAGLYKKDHPQFLAQADIQVQDNVRSLLRSDGVENINLAAEILQNGGITDDLFYDVLFVIKSRANFAGVKKLTKLIKPLLPQELEGVLKSRAKLDRSDEKETDINKKLRKNEAVWGKPFCLFMSLELFRERKQGLRYLFTNTEVGDPMRLKAIELLNKNGFLDWQYAYGFQNDWWSDEKRRRALRFSFPIEIEDKSTITKINLRRCKLDVLPEGMQDFTKIKCLDLCTNGLKELPVWFSKFQELEILDLSDNYLDKFPEVLYQLPHLKKVIFGMQNIRNYHTHFNFIDPPNDLEQKFRNVEFVFQVPAKTYYSHKSDL